MRTITKVLFPLLVLLSFMACKPANQKIEAQKTEASDHIRTPPPQVTPVVASAAPSGLTIDAVEEMRKVVQFNDPYPEAVQKLEAKLGKGTPEDDKTYWYIKVVEDKCCEVYLQNKDGKVSQQANSCWNKDSTTYPKCH